jgi:hypothetical protein
VYPVVLLGLDPANSLQHLQKLRARLLVG